MEQRLILHCYKGWPLMLSALKRCSSRFRASCHYLPVHFRCVSSTRSRRVWRHVLRTCDLGDHGAWCGPVHPPNEEYQSDASFYWTHWSELTAHELCSSLLPQIRSTAFHCFSAMLPPLSASASREYRLHGFDTHSSIDWLGPSLHVSTTTLLHSTTFRSLAK